MANFRVNLLEQLYSARLPKSRGQEAWGDFSVHTLDLRPLKLNLSAFVPFLFLEDDATPPDSIVWRKLIGQLIAYSREQSSGTAVLVADHVFPTDLMEDPDLEKHGIAVLDAPIIESLTRARDNETRYKILGSAMARTLGYSALSPYSPGSPASANRFFGREEVLKRILTGKAIRNSTIVGNRRIGKTSLMHEIRERLRQVYEPGKSLHYAELYGSKCKTTWDAVYLIFQQIGVRIPSNLAKYGAIAPRYVNRMPQLLHEFARSKRTQIVLFIDEYDELLERDALQKYQFTHLLREMAMAELNCSVIIAGFRYLMQMRTRQDSPLYNFTQEIQLTPLRQEESLKMVNLPLSRLGIDVSQTNIPAIIHRETRGQPELIQMYCQAVIQSCSAKRRAPTEAELLKIVNQNPEFNRTITHTFLSNANEFEQLICLELMKKAALSQSGVAQFEFRYSDVQQILAEYGYSLSNSEVAILVNNLAVGSFIERVRGGGAPGLYQFATPQLVRFCESVGFETLIAKAKSKLGSQPPTLEAISREPAPDAGSAVTG
jgi:hypothetical protein